MNRLPFVCVLVCASAFAQSPVPTCPDGSVKFLFANSISGIFVPSVNPNSPETAVEVGTVGGELVSCKLGEPLPHLGEAGHILKFQSGPLKRGNLQTGVSKWGAGGSLVFYSTGENHLPCALDIPCVYRGTWDSLTLRLNALPDGSVVYTFWGSALGRYSDPQQGKTIKNVRATFTVTTLDYGCLLMQCGEGWGSGSLTIATGGVQ